MHCFEHEPNSKALHYILWPVTRVRQSLWLQTLAHSHLLLSLLCCTISITDTFIPASSLSLPLPLISQALVGALSHTCSRAAAPGAYLHGSTLMDFFSILGDFPREWENSARKNGACRGQYNSFTRQKTLNKTQPKPTEWKDLFPL